MDNIRKSASGALSKLNSYVSSRGGSSSGGAAAAAAAAAGDPNVEMRKYWMPDAISKNCYDCNLKFTTFRRRHHCRVCGQIFCANCCSLYISGEEIGVPGKKVLFNLGLEFAFLDESNFLHLPH